MKRRFHAQAPNQVYVGDITYLPCRNGSNMALPFLECIDFVGELSGVDEASKDVVGEVAESKRDSAEVF